MTDERDGAPDRSPGEQLADLAADLFVYAPIGLFFEAPKLLPKLAEQGRGHARNARFLGRFAVRQGEAELRRRLIDLEAQAGGLLRALGLVPDEGTPTPTADGRRAQDRPARARRHAPGPGAARPDVGALAITDYDSLSAPQVVARLPGLAPDELEAVRAYEAAQRGRKTVLNKIAQLQRQP